MSGALWASEHGGWRYELHPTGCGVCPDTGQWILALRGWHHGDPRGGVTLRYHPMDNWLIDVTPPIGNMQRAPIAVLDALHEWLGTVDGWAA